MPDLLYLSHQDVLRCDLSAHEVADAVREAFLARAAGRAVSAPTLHLPLSNAPRPDKFSAKAAALHGAGFAVLKWYGVMAGNAARGLPEYLPTVLLNDLATGEPLAVIDGEWITAERTAAISSVAARLLAPPDAKRLGIVGCGRQGAAHLAALRQVLPIEQVTLYSRSRASAEALAEAAERQGLRARIVDEPREAVEGQDVVVSAISKHAECTGFLRSEWVRKGGFAIAVDMAYAWAQESLLGFDFLVTDELDPATRRSRESLNFNGTFDTDLAGLVARPALSGPRDKQRQALVFAGNGLADAAVAALVYLRARTLGLGTHLPR